MSAIGFVAFSYVAIGLSLVVVTALHAYRSGTISPPGDLPGVILEVYLLTLCVVVWPAFLATALWRR